MKEQLFKKVGEQYIPITALNYIQNIIDKDSKVSLQSIISKYNHIYVTSTGDIKSTRLSIPNNMRRQGLWITYKYNNEYITECNINNNRNVFLDTQWANDSNWIQVPNLKYVNDATLRIPKGGILPEHLSPALQELLANGNTITNIPDDEDLIQTCNVIKLKDREYNKITANGMGYKILRKNWVNGENILTQDMINNINTIYEIRYSFKVIDSITVPNNCILKFNGGDINGVIVSNNTKLITPPKNLDIRGVIYNSNGEVINRKTYSTKRNNLSIHNSFSMFNDSLEEPNIKDKLNMYKECGTDTMWLCILLEYNKNDNIVKVPSWYNKYHELGGLKGLVPFLKEKIGTNVDCIKLHKNYGFEDTPNEPQAYYNFCTSIIDDLVTLDIHKLFISNEENWRTSSDSIWIKSFNDIADYAHSKGIKVGFSMNVYRRSVQGLPQSLITNIDMLYENFYPSLSWKDINTEYKDIDKMERSCEILIAKSINYLRERGVEEKYGISECGIPNRETALRYPYAWNNKSPIDTTGKISDLYWRSVIPAAIKLGVKEIANWYLDEHNSKEYKSSMFNFMFNSIW